MREEFRLIERHARHSRCDRPPWNYSGRRKRLAAVGVNIIAVIARMLLGLAFFVFGLNGFLHFLPGGAPSGLSAEFMHALFASHYAYLVFGVQALAGALLLSRQYVPLALLLLAPVLANILTFHITMMPSGLPPALAVTLLWVIVALRYRESFAALFARTPESR